MDKHEIAALIETSPWRNAPVAGQARYFKTWQRVSVALQNAMRRWIPEKYFAQVETFENRTTSYPLIVYAASRLFYGRPTTEFAYDIADSETLSMALRSIGARLRRTLDGIERRLRDADRSGLARRYAPVWHLDILKEVKKKPQPVLEMLAREARVINDVVDLAAARNSSCFLRMSSASLRKFHGCDLRELIRPILEEATRVLNEESLCGIGDLASVRIHENGDTIAAWAPDFRIGSEENRDHWHARGRGEMRDAGIIANVEPRRSQPLG
jgi:hypothetical protein